MIIEVGTDRYKELFGGRDFLFGSFESKLPPHSLLVEGLADPSKRIEALDEIINDEVPEGILRTAGLMDLQLGTQFLMFARSTASRLGQALTLPGNGLLTSMTEGLVNVMASVKLPARASDQDVQMFLADAAFAIGMKALGAVGPIGKIVAAVLGFARGIYQLVKQRKELAKLDRAQREALAYAKLPPLQELDVEVDAYIVDRVLRPKMEGGSWTAIFSPRFESDEWVVVPRNGGMGMAPGEKTQAEDDFGEPLEVFKAGTGLGLIPGLDQITSVIQVVKDHREFKGWTGGTWPIRPDMVTDVGKFFVNTGRLAAIAWAWATQYDASPDLYKIHVAALHEKWKRYCDGGLRYLLDNAEDFTSNGGKGRVYSGDPRFIFGSAIGCAIGAWRCMPDGNGYRLLTPGLHGDAIMGYGYGREQLGCVMDPPSMAAYAKGQACFYTIYDFFIKPALDQALQRQRYFLRHSLVAAYVRSSFDAFKDPGLKNALIEARKIMLEHPDRKLVELDDVADDEPGTTGGRTWKQQLLDSGVKRRPPFLFDGGRLAPGSKSGTLIPTDDPPPKMPLYDGPMAWGDVPREGPSAWRYAAYAAGGLAVAGGGYALARWLRRRH